MRTCLSRLSVPVIGTNEEYNTIGIDFKYRHRVSIYNATRYTCYSEQYAYSAATVELSS